ncbi:MAG: methyltransferase domain-containing protein [bacterium]|nr:methyltransferase domain-containing protein [bacterium]
MKKKQHFTWGVNEKIIDKAVELISNEKPGKLLDVGAGSGLLCQKALNLGFKAYACDLNAKKLKVRNIPFKKADILKKLPYQDKYFDFVTCTEVFEHLENPWKASAEISRVLKPNGYLILSLPNFSSLVSRFVYFTRGNFVQFDEWFFNNWGHINPLTFVELNKILEYYGFKIEKIDTQERLPQPYSYFLRLLQKTCSILFHYFKLLLLNVDRQDKCLSILETNTLLYGENIIIKCRKI